MWKRGVFVVNWNQWTAGAVGVQRYAIAGNEWVTVEAGRVMLCDAMPVLVVDGMLRLDGVVKGS